MEPCHNLSFVNNRPSRECYYRFYTVEGSLISDPFEWCCCQIHTSNPVEMNFTSRRLYDLFFGLTKEVTETLYPAFVDVRDVAAAHINAIVHKINGRFLVSSGLYDFQKVADFMHKEFPKDSTHAPVGQPGQHLQADQVYTFQSSKAKHILGVSLKPFEKSLRDTLENYLKFKPASASDNSLEES